MAQIDSPASLRRKLATKPFSTGDKIFSRVTSITAYFAFVLVALILFFLFAQSWPALQAQGPAFLYGNVWDNTQAIYQLGPMIWGSVLVAALGVITATPMAVATAYLITFMLPKSLSALATALIDLLAALPSVIIGLWGIYVFTPVAQNWATLLNRYFGWFPLFSSENPDQGFASSPFIAGWIVAVMIVPIVTSVTREIFSQIDRDLINGALALGATRYTVLRRVILPVSSSGIIGGVLLGIGRAIGETVAIFYVLQLSMNINLFQILEPKGGAVASWILSKFAEANETEFHALMAAGLVIFVVTLVINLFAGWIVSRSQSRRNS